ncbi:MAG: tetratricopeptide repeat protein [Myxococcota bacterium]
MKSDRERFDELDDARALGEPLNAEELAFLDAHAPVDDPADALFAEIESYGTYEPLRVDDCRRAEATVSEFNARQAAPRRMPTRVIAVAALAVAAAALVLFVLPGAPSGVSTLVQARVASGAFVMAADERSAGTALPDGEWLEATTRACIDLQGGRACVAPRGQVRLNDGRLELRAGTLDIVSGTVDVDNGQGVRSLGEGDSVSATGEVMALVPTPASVPSPQSAIAPPTPLEPPPPPPTVPDEVAAPTTPPPAPRRKAPLQSASEMLAAARSLANGGKLSKALDAYTALRRTYPKSPDAHAANVSVGLLQLRRGRARPALRAFDRYLKRPGGMAEEARWGRVRALHALGRTAARDQAIGVLLRQHAGSVYATEAKAMRDH